MRLLAALVAVWPMCLARSFGNIPWCIPGRLSSLLRRHYC